MDPTNDVVFVGMIQRYFGAELGVGSNPNVQYKARATVYGAMVDPSK